MNIDKRDKLLIIISTVVAIVVSKIADFILPQLMNLHLLDSQLLDPWINLLISLILLIGFTLFFFEIVSKLAYHTIKED
ncbi:MAG: hypothetical protein AABX83_00750 [Nanoarchaeota archaeon]